MIIIIGTGCEEILLGVVNKNH